MAAKVAVMAAATAEEPAAEKVAAGAVDHPHCLDRRRCRYFRRMGSHCPSSTDRQGELRPEAHSHCRSQVAAAVEAKAVETAAAKAEALAAAKAAVAVDHRRFLDRRRYRCCRRMDFRCPSRTGRRAGCRPEVRCHSRYRVQGRKAGHCRRQGQDLKEDRCRCLQAGPDPTGVRSRCRCSGRRCRSRCRFPIPHPWGAAAETVAARPEEAAAAKAEAKVVVALVVPAAASARPNFPDPPHFHCCRRMDCRCRPYRDRPEEHHRAAHRRRHYH